MEDTRTLLSELLKTSRRLAEAAESEDWESVGKLQVEQQDKLGEMFAGYERPPMTAEMLSGLAQVRVYTDMVLQLARQKRQSIAAAARTVQKGRRAVGAYANCG